MTDRSAIAQFEHEWKIIVDFGMFMFGFANAGVEFSRIGTVTWLVLFSLIIGKSGGIFLVGFLSERFGFSLPEGIGKKELLVAGIIGGFRFTVALFVAGEAFSDHMLQGAAKMGAIMSVCTALIAVAAGRILKISRMP